MVKMLKNKVILVLALVLCYNLCHGAGVGRERTEDEEESWKPDEPFVMQDKIHIAKNEAGEIYFFKHPSGFRGRFTEKPIHLGFMTMEPKSLFVPKYLDSDFILFVRKGDAKIGFIYNDDLVERRLRKGDVYRIPAGSTYYVVNIGEGQRLELIWGAERYGTLGWTPAKPYYITGSTHPKSVLAGFDPETLATAFNVSKAEVSDFLSQQKQDAIVFLPDSYSPSIWTKFLNMEHDEKRQHLKKMVQYQEEDEEEKVEEEEEEDEDLYFSFKKMLRSFFGEEANKKKKNRRSGPNSYNIYRRKPDYKNDYGWSISLDRTEYRPLGKADIGVYIVNLTAGSMLAPHINTVATEYGMVLQGSGRIQVVYPNGTLALDARVTEGDVFYIPRYFPVSQTASRSGPFEFFGFTTSAKKNYPQFLAGANSVLQKMRGPELAASFGVSEERLKKVVEAQRESVIIPSAEAAPSDRVGGKVVDRVIKMYGKQ